jgi:lysyl-tRNA synthetase class I
MSTLFSDLEKARTEQRKVVAKQKTEAKPKPMRNVTRKLAQARDTLRDRSTDNSREKPRSEPCEFPTRDEIQEFSFRLRDELKVKVQAEVPHQWQKELEEIARKLDVRKLELYRFIIGKFLGKVER